MAELPTYIDLDHKRKFFSNGQKESFVINTKTTLDKWFKRRTRRRKRKSLKLTNSLDLQRYDKKQSINS